MKDKIPGICQQQSEKQSFNRRGVLAGVSIESLNLIKILTKGCLFEFGQFGSHRCNAAYVKLYVPTHIF